jgi:hypothetical protein
MRVKVIKGAKEDLKPLRSVVKNREGPRRELGICLLSHYKDSLMNSDATSTPTDCRKTVFSKTTRNCDCHAATAAVPKYGRLGQIIHLVEVDSGLNQYVQVLLQNVRYRVVPHWRRHKHFQQSGSLAI